MTQSIFPQWTTRIDRIRCYCGHPVNLRSPGAILTTQGDCIRPLTCTLCHGHAIGVQSEHHGTIVFYGCGRTVFEQIINWPDDVKTWVKLEAMDFIKAEAA